MKKTIIFCLFALSSSFIFGQADITGDWNGALNVQGIQIRLVFHITKTDAGYASTLDSPDQGARGIPMSTTTYENSTLFIEMEEAAIEYKGKMDKNGTITGVFNQAGQSFPLVLSRGEKLEKVEIKYLLQPVIHYPASARR